MFFVKYFMSFVNTISFGITILDLLAHLGIISLTR